ncbi:hypothetical protein CLV56_1860 [Mumia flava]|uniref:Excreted virulence factor EspC (Type VII ESX diderm) n=1 Tax=Mumia flava TaxID=1348852 RepID=A0A0B2B750_9ACTN|nr:hypothetical protein [Mumia flava]PJJ57624.1 hypothetical protein CLV56_1860 [Mumia flava]
MADLKVDYYRLEDSERVMSQLKSEFDGIEDDVSDSTSVWSHPKVRDAMGDFAGNMDYNRKKLSQKLQDCGEKVSNTLETFRGADAELAKQLDEEREG